MRDAFEVVEADAGKSLQRLLHERLGVSNATAKGLIAAGGVTLDGAAMSRPDRRVRAGERVSVEREPGRRYRTPRRDTRRGDGYRIVHEDDDLVVVEKDAGLLTVPAPSEKGTSLADLLRERYRKRGFRDPEVHAVHRIDRYTSGLVVLARSSRAHAALRRAFAEGRPERVYLALASGAIERGSGRLVHRLAEHPRSLKVHVAPDGEPGRTASCRFRVLERFEHATLLEVVLETGRRNQIRVQLAAEGHPVVGDVAYGTPSPWIARTALHAHRLAFVAPSGDTLRFVAEPPADFRSAVRAARRGGKPADTEDGPETAAAELRRARPAPPRGPGRRYR